MTESLIQYDMAIQSFAKFQHGTSLATCASQSSATDVCSFALTTWKDLMLICLHVAHFQ